MMPVKVALEPHAMSPSGQTRQLGPSRPGRARIRLHSSRDGGSQSPLRVAHGFRSMVKLPWAPSSLLTLPDRYTPVTSHTPSPRRPCSCFASSPPRPRPSPCSLRIETPPRSPCTPRHWPSAASLESQWALESSPLPSWRFGWTPMMCLEPVRGCQCRETAMWRLRPREPNPRGDREGGRISPG